MSGSSVSRQCIRCRVSSDRKQSAFHELDIDVSVVMIACCRIESAANSHRCVNSLHSAERCKLIYLLCPSRHLCNIIDILK